VPQREQYRIPSQHPHQYSSQCQHDRIKWADAKKIGLRKRQRPQQHTFHNGKVAVVAPTPRASISTAVADKPGDFIKCRTAICRSWNGTVLASRIEIKN
jgi:hypothetical protein